MPRKNEMPFSLERGTTEVEYVAVFDYSPEEPMRGPSRDSPGEPGCGASVDGVEVYFERLVPCEAHRRTARAVLCRACKVVRERRPELDDLVDEDELLEHVAEHADWSEPDPDDERDRRRDRDLEERGAGAVEAEDG